MATVEFGRIAKYFESNSKLVRAYIYGHLPDVPQYREAPRVLLKPKVSCQNRFPQADQIVKLSSHSCQPEEENTVRPLHYLIKNLGAH